MTESLLIALGLGLAGAGHCLGMCGGVAIALRPGNSGPALPIAYHAGRLLSYSLLGALLGSAAALMSIAGLTLILRYVAGLLLIAMGLHVLALWSGIQTVERAGATLWKQVVPLTRSLLPPKNALQALTLGGLWGLMPCGLIYSSLAWASSAGGNAGNTALLMLAFGIGTLPAMLGATLAGQRAEHFFRHPFLRRVIGLSLVLAGCWTLYITTAHAPHWLGNHAPHDSHGTHKSHGSQQSEAHQERHAPNADVPTEQNAKPLHHHH